MKAICSKCGKKEDCDGWALPLGWVPYYHGSRRDLACPECAKAEMEDQVAIDFGGLGKIREAILKRQKQDAGE